MRRAPTWPRHALMIAVSILMLIPFYWVAKTSLTGENIYAYPPRIIPVNPHLFNYVDVWYLIPFPRYLLNSVIVTAMAICGNLLFNTAAGYALTKDFPGRRWVVLLFLSCMLIPFQATIIPAYLITSWLGVLNTHLAVALPLLSTIICIFIFKASFEAVPKSLIDAARLDGLSEWRIILRIILRVFMHVFMHVLACTRLVTLCKHGNPRRRAHAIESRQRVLQRGACFGTHEHQMCLMHIAFADFYSQPFDHV